MGQSGAKLCGTCKDDVNVVNYPTETLHRAMAQEWESYSKDYEGLSQVIHTTADDGSENEDVVDFDEQNERSFLRWQSTTSLSNRNSHQILYPRLQELASLYENNEERLREVAAVLDEWILKGKAEKAIKQK